MHPAIDVHADLDSTVHRWDPRCKLVGLTAVIFAFSLVQDLRLVPFMLAVVAALYAASRLPLSFLRTRLRYPGYFLAIVAVLLPFLSGGAVVLRLGPLVVYRDGLLALVLVVAKFAAILTTGLVLFGSAPFLTSIQAMRALGLPAVLADMTLLAYRYLYEVAGDLQAMQTAMRLRGFRAGTLGGRTLGALAALSGSLLVRSYERSERVYQAMVLRGYGNAVRAPDEGHARPRDAALLGLALLTALAFAVAEAYLRHGGGGGP